MQFRKPINTAITLLSFFFLTTGAIAQNDRDYILYHDQILLIEEQNSRGSFDSSISLYQGIFNKYDRVLARDAYNACQIAALRKHKSFRDFFFTCAESGISRSELLSNPLIRSGFAADSAELNVLYTKGRRVFFERIDTTLRREMIRRADNEQKSKGKGNYAAICADNFNRILDLAKQGRFPGEDLIGNGDRMESVVFPTLCHYPYSYRDLEHWLNDALNKGKVSPLSLLYLYGFNQTRNSVLYTPAIQTDSVNFKIIYNTPFGKESVNVSEVNKQRAIRKVVSISVENKLMDLNLRYGLDYRVGY